MQFAHVISAYRQGPAKSAAAYPSFCFVRLARNPYSEEGLYGSHPTDGGAARQKEVAM